MATNALRSQVAAKWQDAFNRLNHGEPGISGLMTFSLAWNLAIKYLNPRDLTDRTPKRQFNMAEVRAAFDMVNQCRRLPALLETFLEEVRTRFDLIAREILAYMAEYEETDDPNLIARLVFRLIEWYEAWHPMAALGHTIISAYALTFHTQLYSTLPPSFSRGFKALCASTLPSSSPAPQDPALWQAFETLGLVDRYESLVASVGYEHIEAHVLETCRGRWSEPLLGELRDWMSDKIVPWMCLPYARGASSAEEARTMLQGVGSRFDFHMNKTLCNLRTSEIFDMIIDFPDSMGALQDLKECLQRVDQRSALVKSLRKANKQRLLHPGADTKLILSQYVATIRCLRIVDPPGVLLFKVADPIRRYLRERGDTIRSIVANLVGDDDEADSLVDENEPIRPLQQTSVEDYADPEWNPDPVDAGPDFRANKPSDIVSTLVSIYDSQDLFVKELQVLLAQRLLSNSGDGENERERRNVEILKVRFGEVALQACEVMLKDMKASSKINQHIHSQKASVIHPTVISKHFWPALESGEIVMPGQFQRLQEEYAKEFNLFKPDKKLKWLPHLGTVSLELELEDRVVNAEVPPLEAAFIELFSEKSVWTMDELTARVGMSDRIAALKALITWVDLGVLKEDSENTFRLLEVAEEAARDAVKRTFPGLEEPVPLVTAQQQQAEQMKVYWKFIEGMLTNLGQLPLDRIQTMLRFAPGYDRTIEQLGAFMEAAQREGLASIKDGLWRLN